MDETTLATLNTSISQVNCRIDDMNGRLGDLNNRCNETNITLRLLITENSNSHRDLTRKIDQACRLIGKSEKETSVCAQKVTDHLKAHKKEDERMNINGVKVTSMIGSFGSALVGAMAVLFSVGMI